MKRLLLFTTAAMITVASSTALGYLKFGASSANGIVPLKWQQLPVRYFVRDRGVGGVSAEQARAAFAAAFSSWEQVPTAAIRYEFAGFTSASPLTADGIITLGFEDRPDLERVLGATRFVTDRITGELVESDIFFNTAFEWSVAANGEAGRYDLQSTALHEIGHLGGLAHSQLGETEVITGGRRVIAAEAVMFPIAFSRGSVIGRTLRADDVAGISDIYPDSNFLSRTGIVRGRVTKDGRGIFGAHVIAMHLQSGRLVAGFTLNDDGSFAIAGLEPGVHLLRVEPLDDVDVESVFDSESPVETAFDVTFADRTVVVPAGGASASIDIAVKPR